MANTYTQIYIHLIFAVKHRASLIPREHKAELQKYITGVITNQKCKLIAIENEPDHIHILIGLRPDTSLSDLVRDIKANFSRWINEQEWMKFEFRWQEGYGAFSYSRSQLSEVIEYIRNQEEHHKKRTFLEEYIALLKAFEVEYDPKYTFNPWNNMAPLRESSSVRSEIFVAPCVSSGSGKRFAISSSVGATHRASNNMSLLRSYVFSFLPQPPAHAGGYKYSAPTELDAERLMSGTERPRYPDLSLGRSTFKRAQIEDVSGEQSS